MTLWRSLVAGSVATAMLASCGGDGGGGGGAPTQSTPAPAPTPTPAAGCSLRERQDWALATLREWYLFPETLPAAPDASAFGSVSDYIDSLTATARSQRRDRYFTYVTSIAAENAFYDQGSSAGFGIRLAYDGSNRLFVSEAFEGAPALAAGIDRGAEIVAIGTTAADARTVAQIFANGGAAAVTEALGPSTPGTARLLRVVQGGATRDVVVAKADYQIAPVSDRYGVRVIEDGGRRIGYLNLRTFITPAEAPLRAAFQRFRDEGVTELIVDLRYNGGGLVSVADLIGDLMARARSTADVWSYTSYRPEKAARDGIRRFNAVAQAVAPTRVAFIGTGGTASASELVINGQLPYLRGNVALVGANTFGKPVGQIAIDRPACDDRLRVVAFATRNAARGGDYFNGLASSVEASCRAGDDYAYLPGDPREASTRQALDFIQGRSCTPIGTAASAQASGVSARRELLVPDHPSASQRETPGAF